MSEAAEVENQLASLRARRGLSAAGLATAAGVSRQTVYAIESGAFVPNTAVALRLARALDCTVEELFRLPEDSGAHPTEKAELLPAGEESLHAGQAVQLCRVGKRLVASPPSPQSWYFAASDGVVTEAGPKVSVRRFETGHDFGNRILAAGCDPGISVLARHAQAGGLELVLAHRNSSQALDLLKAATIHIAGTHLKDGGEAVRQRFGKGAVAVIAFAVWEEGLVTAPGNPKGICGVEDLARKNVQIVNREPGSGSRNLLDERLRAAAIPHETVRGYDRLAFGHLPAAWQVYSGEADCCLATGGAARVFGLDFVPLASERYDLVIRKSHLELPRVQQLLDVLCRARFRRELEGLGGYDMRVAGERIL